MSRPKKQRNVCLNPSMIENFAPVSKAEINKYSDIVILFCDEVEAMKLINIDGMCMKTGGGQLGISAATFNRILNSAYKKVTDAIINGKAIVVKKNE